MKKFENPTIQINNLEIEDVITTSQVPTEPCLTDGVVCPTDMGLG